MSDDLEKILDPVSLAAFRQLEKEGAANLLAELLAIFLSEAPPRLERIHLALERREFSSVARESHLLCGGAGGLGIKKLQALARELEIQAKANSFLEGKLIYSHLEAECVRIFAALRAVANGHST